MEQCLLKPVTVTGLSPDTIALDVARWESNPGIVSAIVILIDDRPYTANLVAVVWLEQYRMVAVYAALRQPELDHKDEYWLGYTHGMSSLSEWEPLPVGAIPAIESPAPAELADSSTPVTALRQLLQAAREKGSSQAQR
jgi:hypothetical protein